jgi:hypothetical protein
MLYQTIEDVISQMSSEFEDGKEFSSLKYILENYCGEDWRLKQLLIYI